LITRPYGKVETTPIFSNINVEKVTTTPSVSDPLGLSLDILGSLAQNVADIMSDTKKISSVGHKM
jgi:hypothetical protein